MCRYMGRYLRCHLRCHLRPPLLSLCTALFAALTVGIFTASAPVQAATYDIDPTHTFATFEILHFATSTTRGRFDKKEGTIQFDRAAKTGKIEIDIFTNSINTGIPIFDKFLQGFTMFDSATYPTARFVADKFNFEGDKVTDVSGNFTLLGKTNPVTLKASNFNCYSHPTLKREVCGGDFETTIDRSQYGMNYGLIFGFTKVVHLVIQVEAIHQ